MTQSATALRSNIFGCPTSLFLFAAIALPFLIACSDDNNRDGGQQDIAPVPAAAPFAELYEQGINRYIGMYTPMLSEVDGDIVNHSFGAGDGPLCLDGSEYTMATRDLGSDELMIFLEGGGACWSDICLATASASAGIPSVGLTDPNRTDNPAMGWSQVYLPYCDGSLHIGDADTDTDGDDVTDRFQRGLHNLSASLDVAASTFPSPSRILLAGNSGGGYGTIFALPLVRSLYPGIPIEVVNDSGVGVGRPGAPEFIVQLMEEWNTEHFLPESCDDTCIGEDGHLTEYLIWQLDEDEDVRLSMLSYTGDPVIADFFLQIGKDAFSVTLREEMQQLEDAHPARMHSMIAEGVGHTFVQLSPDKVVDGVAVLDWIGLMLSGSDEWVSLAD